MLYQATPSITTARPGLVVNNIAQDKLGLKYEHSYFIETESKFKND